MVSIPEYSVHMQAKLIAALAVLHNFIRINDPDDDANPLNTSSIRRGEPMDAYQERGIGDDRDDGNDFGGVITRAEQGRAKERRDRIAEQMWKDYISHLTQNLQ